MTREHLSRPEPMMEICPENSRYWMKWDTNANEFTIGKKGGTDALCTLDLETGKYVYATMRGQQRMEEMAQSAKPITRGVMHKDSFMRDMTRSGIAWSEEQLQELWKSIKAGSSHISPGGKEPVVTHRHIYLGKEAFVHSEDVRPRTGMDLAPRIANRAENCFTAANSFIRLMDREAVRTRDISMDVMPTYERLAAAVEHHPLPLLVEVATIVKPVQAQFERAHAFIVLAKEGSDYICFEKVGDAYPWRLAPMREIYDMYEKDFRAANSSKGEPHVSWIASTLAEASLSTREVPES